MTRVIYLLSVWPEPRSTATGIRSRDLVRQWLDQGWEVACVCSAPWSEHTDALVALGAEAHQLPANDSSFDAWVAARPPTFAVFDRFYTEELWGWRVEQASPKTIRVLDTQDLHCLRKARDEAVAAELASSRIEAGDLPFFAEAGSTAERELSAIYRSDLTLLCSDFEAQLLRERFGVPSELLTQAPLFFPEPAPSRPLSERRAFVTIGNFRHPPNADGVRWLRHALWPRIRVRLPQATVEIWGAYLPREIQSLHDANIGFLTRGHAPDQYALLSRYRVNLAPLRSGAGIKGKIADGWLVGTPCVTTPIGAEGMTGDDGGFAGIIARDPEAFAIGAVTLYSDDAAWESASLRGLDTVRQRFTANANGPRLIAAFQAALDFRDERRERNLTGRLLRYGLARGTEYFGRWIEIKNQLKRISPAESLRSSPSSAT